MNNLLRADFYRMYRKRKLWICVLSMLAVSAAMIVMQYTAMDYKVSLDRVIFLPMTFYGLAIGALTSFYIGDDFCDGVIRNKLIGGNSRSAVYFSNLFVCCSAALAVYLLTTAFTFGVGVFFFQCNVSQQEFLHCFLPGLLTCMAFTGIFGMISMLCAERTVSVMVCMALAFVMLFLCLHTNQIVIQQPMKNGMPNPHYVGGMKRAVYEILHDLNPYGQTAQLSSMECFSAVRWICMDLIWIFVSLGPGSRLFAKKDLK